MNLAAWGLEPVGVGRGAPSPHTRGPSRRPAQSRRCTAPARGQAVAGEQLVAAGRAVCAGRGRCAQRAGSDRGTRSGGSFAPAGRRARCRRRLGSESARPLRPRRLSGAHDAHGGSTGGVAARRGLATSVVEHDVVEPLAVVGIRKRLVMQLKCLGIPCSRAWHVLSARMGRESCGGRAARPGSAHGRNVRLRSNGKSAGGRSRH